METLRSGSVPSFNSRSSFTIVIVASSLLSTGLALFCLLKCYFDCFLGDLAKHAVCNFGKVCVGPTPRKTWGRSGMQRRTPNNASMICLSTSHLDFGVNLGDETLCALLQLYLESPAESVGRKTAVTGESQYSRKLRKTSQLFLKNDYIDERALQLPSEAAQATPSQAVKKSGKRSNRTKELQPRAQARVVYPSLEAKKGGKPSCWVLMPNNDAKMSGKPATLVFGMPQGVKAVTEHDFDCDLERSVGFYKLSACHDCGLERSVGFYKSHASPDFGLGRSVGFFKSHVGHLVSAVFATVFGEVFTIDSSAAYESGEFPTNCVLHTLDKTLTAFSMETRTSNTLYTQKLTAKFHELGGDCTVYSGSGGVTSSSRSRSPHHESSDMTLNLW